MNKKRLRNLRLLEEIRSVILGEFDSIRSGSSGFEFDQIRPYEFGDPITRINMKETLAHGEVYVDARKPERELEMAFVLDCSPSMDFGSHEKSKIKYAQDLMLQIISWTHSEDMRYVLYLRSGQGANTQDIFLGRHGKTAHKALSQCVFAPRAQANTATVVETMLRGFSDLVKNKSNLTIYAVIISDFMFSVDYTEWLKGFVARGNKAVGLALMDPMEYDFPEISRSGFYMRDSETGQVGLVGEIEDYLTPHKQAFMAAGCRFEVIGTGERRFPDA